MPFNGKRVLALESRRAAETAELIRRNGGEPFVARSMREVPIEQNTQALDYGQRLLHGEFDMTILLTGVGTRYLFKVLETRFEMPSVMAALASTTLVARGPKPVGALREVGLQPSLVAPEPNTWREVLDILQSRPERRIAIQEYGRPSTELIDALLARGAEVTTVPVYQWQMPEDRGPLEDAARRLAEKEFEVVLFTTSQQIVHLFDVAEQLHVDVRAGLQHAKLASIGPTTTEMMREYGLEPAMEPSHPKLGILVKEAADRL